jgi:tRNA-splicing endonuclease subunit Sen2
VSTYLYFFCLFLFVHDIRFQEMTSEEITAKRREERKQFKFDRAQALAAAAAEAEVAFAEGREAPSTISADGTRSIPSAATWKPQRQAPSNQGPSASEDLSEEHDEEPLEDVEHLQLTLPEAFFLLWNLDCLTVYNPDTVLTLHASATTNISCLIYFLCRTSQ